MDNSVRIALIIAGVILALAFAVGIFLMQLVPSNTISAQGESSIKAIPDLVGIYFSIQTKGVTAKEAKDINSKIVDDTVTALIKLGLQRDEIITENFNVYPDYNWDDGYQKIKGYTATHNIKVQLSTNNSWKIGEIIDSGVDAGALISYINFELSPGLQNKYKAEALKLASEDAKIKAESTAAGLGKRLGKLVSVSSTSFNYYPWSIYRNEAMASGKEDAKIAATSIQPGSQDITASVLVSYKIR